MGACGSYMVHRVMCVIVFMGAWGRCLMWVMGVIGVMESMRHGSWEPLGIIGVIGAIASWCPWAYAGRLVHGR